MVVFLVQIWINLHCTSAGGRVNVSSIKVLRDCDIWIGAQKRAIKPCRIVFYQIFRMLRWIQRKIRSFHAMETRGHHAAIQLQHGRVYCWTQRNDSWRICIGLEHIEMFLMCTWKTAISTRRCPPDKDKPIISITLQSWDQRRQLLRLEWCSTPPWNAMVYH